LRDAMRTVQTLHDRQQKMATAELGHRDVFGVKVGPAGVVIQVFQVRHGRVVERVELGTEEAIAGSREGDVLEAALQQFYEARGAPPEIHVPAEPNEREALEIWLSERAGRRVRLLVPQRGGKRGLVDLANRNAAIAYQTRFNQTTAAQYDALETLQDVLGLPAVPRRIECFDISTFQGSETVASMVVCEDGRMRRSEYRKFRIRHPRSAVGSAAGSVAKPDDFAAMRDVVLRRYQRIIQQGGPFPDLVLIDGGKGQVSAAYESLEALGLANLVAVGLAKKEELIVTRDRPEPIVLDDSHPSLLLLQRIRDEAHRVAVTFHRAARRMRDLQSELDAIAGIGPRRRRALLEALGSVAGVRRASREALTAVVGAKAADAVLAHYARLA